MNLLEKIIVFLSYQLEAAPKMYSWFHWSFLLLTIFMSIYTIYRFRNLSEKQSNRFLLIASGIMLTFEVYKQLTFSFNGETWDYQWYAFPFQFCSVPMYAMLITGLLKTGKLKNAFYTFLGTYSLFAGIAVMFYPDTVFTATLGISIQTMVHHGMMVIVGVFALSSGKIKLESKSIFGAIGVFSVFFVMAFLMNVLVHQFIEETFNMFFVGPYIPTHLVILVDIQTKFGYIPFLISYLVGFSLLAYCFLGIGILVKKLKESSRNVQFIQKKKRSAH